MAATFSRFAPRLSLGTRLLRPLLAFALALGVFAPTARSAGASDGITVLEETVRTEWPDAVVFTVKLSSASEITRIRIEYWYTSHTRAGGNPTFTPGKEVTAEFRLRTRGAQDVPPGALIHYRYVVEDAAGTTLRTEPNQYRFLDTRSRWQSVQDGLITVFYNERTQPRAQAILQSAVRTVNALREQAGVQLAEPLTVVAYPTPADLDSAYPPRSQSSRGSRAGVSVSGFNVVLVTTEGDAIGTTAHEVTHAVVEDTIGPGAISGFPMWLNEGLATYFQPSQGAEWSQYLQQAIRLDRVMPLRFLKAYPGREEEWLLVYAQGVSMVRYLLTTYGAQKMGELLRAYRDGDTDERTFERVYGKSLLDLENEWRASIGVKPLDSTTASPPINQPQPRPTLPPLVIDQPGSQPGAQPTPGPATRPQGAASQTGRLQAALPLLLVGGGVFALLLFVALGALVIARRNSF
ncbi:MAG: peptidase MA family metallohydrolase [Dehalococcoidia bacterium]|nr:peptidase MA family metallohydrolase [Dehalococcoidia bacterium]